MKPEDAARRATKHIYGEDVIERTALYIVSQVFEEFARLLTLTDEQYDEEMRRWG